MATKSSEAQKRASAKYRLNHLEELRAKDRIANMSEEEREIKREYNRSYYKKRKLEGKMPEYVYSPEYFQLNKERIYAAQRRYNLKNKSAQKEYQKKFYEANRERILERQKDYRDREDVKIKKKIYQKRWYELHSGYRVRKYHEAKERKALNEGGEGKI